MNWHETHKLTSVVMLESYQLINKSINVAGPRFKICLNIVNWGKTSHGMLSTTFTQGLSVVEK